MQNNLRNRSVALASTFALALTGIVATAPAAQAQETVGLAPSEGTNLGAFTTDQFSMDITVPRTYAPSEVAIRIDNPEQQVVGFGFSTNDDVSAVTLRGFGATGASVDLSSADLNNTLNTHGTNRGVYFASGDSLSATVDTGELYYFDFADLQITSLVIVDLDSSATSSPADRDIQLDLKLASNVDGTAMTFGGGDGKDVTVTAWVETEASADVSTADGNASSPATVKWYDPKGVAAIPTIERWEDRSGNLYLNSVTTATNRRGIAGSIRFVQPDLNLEQVNRGLWDYELIKDAVTDTPIDTGNLGQIDGSDVAGTGAKANDDVAGAIFTNTALNNDDDTLSAASTYFIQYEHNGDTTPKTKFRSVAFSPNAGPAENRTLFVTSSNTSNTDAVQVAPGDTNSSGQPEASGDVDRVISVRPGVSAITYTARLYDSISTNRVKSASQPILAVVSVNSFAPEGTSYTVSGSSETLNGANETVIVSGLTNSDGDYSVKVTASNPVKATGYDVEFYSLTSNDDWSNALVDSPSSSTTRNAITATYASASVGTPTLAEDTLAGATVTATATAKDSYGIPTNTDSTGKQLYMTFQSSDGLSLDETVEVGSNGVASVTFENYVSANASDLVTVSLHTGAVFSTTNRKGSPQVISLYNASDIAGINLPAAVTGVITYDDFITGTASATNVAPDDTAMSITGTLVDENGAGVPGGLVTVEAEGFQLRKSGTGDYSLDSISFAANAAGQFTVDLWAHTVNTTGVDVTFSSGGQSATTTVKTYLPGTGVDGNNLVFSMDTPATIDVNKTYAMTATLTDKWGNPIQTIDNGSTSGVTIVGTGSVEINSAPSGVSKNFGKDGSVTVFVRSIKDIEGPGAITATLNAATYTYWDSTATATEAVGRAEITTDVAGTAHDETSFSNELTVDVNVGEAAQSSTQKVNAGSFKGYVAVYALGYEGQRLSAKIGNDWVIVDPIVNNESANLARVTDFTGAGYDIAVRIYIDRVLIDTINLTTK